MDDPNVKSYQIVRESGKSSDPDFFRFLVENTKDVIFHLRIEPTRGFEYVSSSITAFMGYSPEDFYADPDLVLKSVHPDDASIVLAARSDHRLYARPMKMRMRKKDGTLFWCELLGQVIHYEETSEIAYQGVMRDITQMIAGQEELLSRNRELQIFYRFSEIIAQSGTLEDAYFKIADEIRRSVGFPITSIALCDEEANRMTFRGWSGLKPMHDKYFTVSINKVFAGLVLRKREAVHLTNVPDGPEYDAPLNYENHIQTYVGFPMVLNNEIVGVLNLADTVAHPIENRFMEWGQSLANMVASLTERKRIEQALVESERKYGAIFNNSHAPMLLFDPVSLDILEVNPAACQFYGYAKETFVRMKVPDINDHNREEIFKNIREKLNGRKSPSRYQNRLANGERRTVEVFSGPIESNGRQLLFAIIHDITEEEKAERALKESEKRYRDLAESMPFIIWRSDLNGSVDYYNKRWYEFTGRIPENSIGYLGLDAIHPEDAEEARRRWTIGNREKTSYDIEYRLRNRDGDYRWFQGGMVPIINREGDILRWYGSALDITDQKEAQEAVRRGERRFRAIFEQAEAGIAHLNLEMKCILINHKLCEMMGFSSEEMRDKAYPDLFYRENSEEIERDRIAVRRLLDGEIEEISSEKRIIREDSRTLWVLETLSVEKDDDDRPLYFIAILQDITKSKRTESALEVSNSQLQEALAELRITQKQIIRQERLRALGQMASGIAHDFNNALMPILGFSELLLQRSDYLADMEKSRRYLNLILSGAQGAARTVNRLREFYRKPGDDNERIPVDFERLALEAIDLTEPKWKDEARANNGSILVRTQFSGEITILGDESDLREALINLILNAVDAMPSGGILDISANRTGEAVILEVRDSGSGMSEETRERCLEPFFTTKEERGTGLGLAMVHGIVSRHEGRIEIESEADRGSTFRLHFPLGSSKPKEKLIERSQTKEIRPMKILLAEDDPSIRGYLSERLISDGHEVESAEDGRTGRDLFRRGRFDLVITDYSMPAMSGERLARSIKETAPETPILMLTGFGDLMNGRDETPQGVDLVLSKPILYEDLKAGIASLLSRCLAEEGEDSPPELSS